MLEFRLKETRKQKGCTQAALADALNVTQQAVAKWESGKASPKPRELHRMAEALGVSVDYLLGRDGSRDASPDGALNGAPGGARRIPIVGAVRAGYDGAAFEDDLGEEFARVDDGGEYFFLAVKGDSMEPLIYDGDIALVRRQQTLNNGDLGVVVYGDGEGTLKLFYAKGGRVVLHPFNKSYEALTISGADLADIHIAGKVVETRRRW